MVAFRPVMVLRVVFCGGIGLLAGCAETVPRPASTPVIAACDIDPGLLAKLDPSEAATCAIERRVAMMLAATAPKQVAAAGTGVGLPWQLP